MSTQPSKNPHHWWEKKSTWSWLRIGAEYVAVIILFTHFLPVSLVEKWKENGLLAICFLGICMIIALISNYLLTVKFQRGLDQERSYFKEKEAAFQKKESEQNVLFEDLQRKAKYADVFPRLNKAFSSLHNAERSDISSTNEQKFKEAFKDFCTTLSQVFTNLTGHECHVCIKIPIKTGNNNKKADKLKAKTLVRDSLILNRDEIDGKTNIDHLLSKNTDFEYIFQNIQTEKGRYFFCNDLPQEKGYKNTSFLAYGQSITFFHENASATERENDWPLKYRATVNAAVCPGITEQRNSGTLVGFLCVDSPNKNVFIQAYDAEIISGCADGLYNPLKKYIETYLTQKKPNP